MKKIINVLVLVICTVGLVTYSSCKKDPDPVTPVTDVQLKKLIPSAVNGTETSTDWKLSAATLDGVDKIQANDYSTAFTLTLTGTVGASTTQTTFKYKTSKPTANLSPWAQTGTFTFDGTTPESKVKRDDGLAITYTVNDTQLQLSFNYTGTGSDRSAGKTNVVAGQWVFTFIK